MKNRILLLLYSLFLFSSSTYATHIVGGSLTYEQLANSTYRVTLSLYRDCKTGSAAFPSTVDITVTKSDGTPYSTISIPFPGASAIPPNIDTCVANPGVCLEEAVYTTVINNLPSVSGGYYLYFQYCCRNATLQNITNPINAGETWYAHIADSLITTNSSPKWVNPPPVFVCEGKNINIDHSATDVDGDSLFYSLYTPFDGDIGPGPLDPTFPGNVFTVQPVSWSGSYSANNPLDATMPNSLTITPGSGIISGIPPTLGQFVAGVSCKEYRNGVLIGEIFRDFQFNVVNCPQTASASFYTDAACNEKTVLFVSTTSPAANTYFWDFGDGSTLADTATSVNPAYTYPSLASYTATLIVNKGTPCADTAIQTVNMPFVISNFASNTPACKNTPVNFISTSTVDTSSIITNWDWDFGDGTTSTTQDPVHAYNTSGVFNVRLITTSSTNCKDTIIYPVSIQSLPAVDAGKDTIICSNNATIVLNGGVINAAGGIWYGNGTFNPGDTLLNAFYTPSATAIANGGDTLFLISTGNGVCPADTDQVVFSIYQGPFVNAGADIFVCKDETNIPLSAVASAASGCTWQTTGNGTLTNSSQWNAFYFPGSADTSTGSVILYIKAVGNGDCQPSYDSVKITFTSLPTVAIASDDSVCAGSPVSIGVNVSTGAGTWSSSGSGTFGPNSNSLTGYYYPSAADAAAGNVLLLFTSSNNGGCHAAYDTASISLMPSPAAAYTSISACSNAQTMFSSSSTSVSPITNWMWNFGDGNTSSAVQNPSHIYASGGIYNVSLAVISANGCTDTVTQPLNVFYKPNAEFDVMATCLNNETSFLDSSTVNGSTINAWNWNFGDATSSTLQNPAHVYSALGNYTVTLVVQSSQGCWDTVVQTTAISTGPLAAFLADHYTANANQPVAFTDQSVNNPVTWLWNFGDSSADSISVIQNPTHSYSIGGYYNVCLAITDMNGCADTICETEIISSPPAVPTGFTPNTDGQNDMLYVYGGPFKIFELKIYNNWGELIFESLKQSEGWDGKRKGVEQPVGVYVYTFVGITADGVKHTLSGDVTLLR